MSKDDALARSATAGSHANVTKLPNSQYYFFVNKRMKTHRQLHIESYFTRGHEYIPRRRAASLSPAVDLSKWPLLIDS